MQPFTLPQAMSYTVQLQDRLAFKHVEELTRTRMVMPLFDGARWHPFFDDTQIIQSQQMPTIAGLTPTIVLCICLADRGHISTVSAQARRDVA